MKVAIEEERAPKEVVLRVALRVLLGAVVLGRGLDLLWTTELGAWARGHAQLDLAAVGGTELLAALLDHGSAALAVGAGAFLVLGWMTRPWAGVAAALAGVSLWNLSVSATTLGVTGWPIGLEGALFQLGLGVTYLLLGGGVGSIDHLLRERARVRAIQNDNLWLVAPYVERPRATD